MLELKAFLIPLNAGEWNDNVLSWTNDTKSDCCQWMGVECNRKSGRITNIAFGIGFIIENPLLNLSLLHPFEDVRSLDLSSSRSCEDCGFSGLFDDVEGYKSLSRLRNLEILDLSSHRFNNSIFPFLNAATSLTTLFLTYNNMHSPFLVKEFKDLTNLEHLDLRGNRFNGSIPTQDYNSLRRFRKLEILDLSDNLFNSRIFPFLNSATSLKSLSLWGNNMGGPFPAKELRDLTNVELLDLSRNRFNGSIPVRGNGAKLYLP